MRLTIYFLFISSLSFSQHDSISPTWNKCSIDTLFTSTGNLSQISIRQDEWSKSKKQMITQIWTRKYFESGVVLTDYTGSYFYKGGGYIQHNGVRKKFNKKGRRISTKQIQQQTPSII